MCLVLRELFCFVECFVSKVLLCELFVCLLGVLCFVGFLSFVGFRVWCVFVCWGSGVGGEGIVFSDHGRWTFAAAASVDRPAADRQC